MSETLNAEVPETGTEGVEQADKLELPADHPLVKALAAQKAEIKDLRIKARRLDEIEEANKSEAEKAADRIAKAEAEASAMPAKLAAALKEHLAALHKLDAEDVELFLTAEDPDLLLKQVTRLLGQSDKRQLRNHVPREGANPSPEPVSDMREFARNLFGNNP